MLFNFPQFLLLWLLRGARLIGSLIDSQVYIREAVTALLRMDLLHRNGLQAFLSFPQNGGHRETKQLLCLTAHFPATRQMQPKRGSSLILRTIRHTDFHLITSSAYAVTPSTCHSTTCPRYQREPPENNNTAVDPLERFKWQKMFASSGTCHSPLLFQIEVGDDVFERDREIDVVKSVSHK